MDLILNISPREGNTTKARDAPIMVLTWKHFTDIKCTGWCLCLCICALMCLPVISYFLEIFSHSLIPSPSRLRINYMSIDWPLGRGIDIHRPPSAARPMCIPAHRSQGYMHYRISLFIMILCDGAPRRPLWREKVPMENGHNYARLIQENCFLSVYVCTFKCWWWVYFIAVAHVWQNASVCEGLLSVWEPRGVLWLDLWCSDIQIFPWLSEN